VRPWRPAGLLLFLSAMGLASSSASADTTVPGGTLPGDTTWDAAGSPFILEGDIVVPAGVTLTIEAGVDVGWNGTNALIVEGGLVVNGTAAAPVNIYATGMSFFPHWVGIQFTNHTIDSVVRNATLDRATLAIEVRGPAAPLLVEDVFVTSVSGYGDWGLWVDGAASNVVVHRLDMRSIAQGAYLGNSSGIEVEGLRTANLGLSSAFGLVAYNVRDSQVAGVDLLSARIRLERVTNMTLSNTSASTAAGLDTVEVVDSVGLSVVGADLQGSSGTRLRFHNVSALSVAGLDTSDSGGGSRGPAVWGTASAGVSVRDVRAVGGAYALRMDAVTGLVALNISSTGLGQGVFLKDCPAFVLDGADLSAGTRPLEIAGTSDGGRVSNASLTSFSEEGFHVRDAAAHPDLDVSRGNTVAGWPVLGVYREAGVFVANASAYAWVYVFGSPNVTVVGVRLAERPSNVPAAVWADSPGGRLEDWTVGPSGESEPGIVLSNSPATSLERVGVSGGPSKLWALDVDGLRIANSSFGAPNLDGAPVFIRTSAGVELSNVSTLHPSAPLGVTIYANRVRVDRLSPLSSFGSSGLFVEGSDVRVTNSLLCGWPGLTLNNVSGALVSNISFCARFDPGIVLRATSNVTVENSSFDGLDLSVDVGGGASASFRWNTFARCNGRGLQLAADAGAGTEVYENTFECGPLSARDGSSAAVSWYNATTRRGNYWDDYNGTDADGDGIGDTPYAVPGGSHEDQYPLMTPLDGVPPVAVAFSPYAVDEDTPAPLDGSNSTDNLGFLRGWWVIDLPWGPANVSGLVATYVFEWPGQYNVTLFVSDGWSVSSASTHVTVRDVTPPTVLVNPSDVTMVEDVPLSVSSWAIDNDPAFPGGATYGWSLSGPVSREWTTPSGSTTLTPTEPGAYLLMAFIEDAAGNRGSATSNITVLDTTAPACTAQAELTGSGPADWMVTSSIASAADNDPAFPGPGAFAWRVTFPDGTALTGGGLTFAIDPTSPGDYTVAFSCADPSGNTRGGNLSVTVPDNEGPSWEPPALLVVGDGGESTLSAADATDFSGVAKAEWSDGGAPLGEGLNLTVRWTGLGDHTVTVTLTDGAGNPASYSVLVRVVDRTAPTLSNASFAAPRQVRAGAVLTIGAEGAFADNDPSFPAGALFEWDSTGAVSGWTAGPDNRSLSVSFPEPGNRSVRVTVTDAAGNAASFVLPIVVTPEGSSPPPDGGGAGGSVPAVPLLLLVAAGAGTALWVARHRRPR